MEYLARFAKYDIDQYNCTDWALEVFNHVRSPLNQLVIPKFDVPYSDIPDGSSTPQGLYLKLQEMKKIGRAGSGECGYRISERICGGEQGGV